MLRSDAFKKRVYQYFVFMVCGSVKSLTDPMIQGDAYEINRFLIEVIAQDYDHALYLETMLELWDELAFPQFPSDIRSESSRTDSFPPFSVRNEHDDVVQDSFLIREDAFEYAREMWFRNGGVYYIQNGHENTIESIGDSEEL